MWDELLKIISTQFLDLKPPFTYWLLYFLWESDPIPLGMQVSSELTYVKVALHEFLHTWALMCVRFKVVLYKFFLLYARVWRMSRLVHLTKIPSRQFWDCGRWKSDSLWNFSIVGCQWTVNCLLGRKFTVSCNMEQTRTLTSFCGIVL